MKFPGGGFAESRWVRSESARIRLALGGAVLLTSLVVFRSDLAFLFAPDPRPAFVLAENLSHGVVSPQGSVALDGVIPGPHGFSVPPGGRGRVQYETSWNQPATPWVRLEVAGLLGQRGPRGRISLSADGGRHFHTLAENRIIRGDSFEVGSFLRGQRQILLLFEGENPGGEPLVLAKKIHLQILVGPPQPAPPLRRALPAFLLFGLGVCLLSSRWRRHLPLLGILAVGFLGRYLNFLRVLYARPEPDAETFRILADRLVPFTAMGFYSGEFGAREPFFLLVAKAAFALFGSSDTHLRFVSLAASLLAIGLAWRLGRRLLGENWAWLPAAGLALSVPVIVESGRGLRLEVEMALLLLFADVAFVEPRLRPWPRLVLAGAIGGVLVLTRSSHLPGLVVLLVLAAGRWAEGLRRRALLAGAGAVLLVGLYAPHVAALYRNHGDPFHEQATHARWFANQEFAGQAGFPTREEVARNAYAGPRISFWGYVFGLHTPGQIVVSYLRGFAKALFRMEVVGYPLEMESLVGLRLGWVDWIVRIFGWAGMLLALRMREAWLPIAILVLAFPVAFQYDRGVVETHRLILTVFPFFLCGIGLVSARLAAGLRALRAGRTPECSHA